MDFKETLATTLFVTLGAGVFGGIKLIQKLEEVNQDGHDPTYYKRRIHFKELQGNPIPDTTESDSITRAKQRAIEKLSKHGLAHSQKTDR